MRIFNRNRVQQEVSASTHSINLCFSGKTQVLTFDVMLFGDRTFDEFVPRVGDTIVGHHGTEELFKGEVIEVNLGDEGHGVAVAHVTAKQE